MRLKVLRLLTNFHGMTFVQNAKNHVLSLFEMRAYNGGYMLLFENTDSMTMYFIDAVFHA